jgi:hypothetical protein
VIRRAVFGDFIGAARRDLGSSDSFREAVREGGYVAEIRHSLLRVLIVMSRYVRDARVVPDQSLRRAKAPLAGWDRAGAEAREALSRAAAALHGDAAGQRGSGVRPGSELARRLDAASVSLTFGRDLLQTHLAQDPRGGREFRSEWGSVLSSPPVSWALLAEMGSLAHHLATVGDGLGRSPRTWVSPEEGRRLNAACNWLQRMDASIRVAQRHRPVFAADRELLHAIPVNERPPRRLPDGSEPVGILCEGVIATAERALHAAWLSAMEPAWSPRVTVNSWRQVAAASTVTSHHCEILLRSLTNRVGREACGDGLRAELERAADAAGRARAGWLRLAHALDHVTTDVRGRVSQAAIEASDLALWTGRLAYADPEWTLAAGPGRESRPAQSLAPEAGDVPRVAAAISRACESLTRLAHADGMQVRAAGHAGRILVAAESSLGALDTPPPFAPAPPDRIDAMLTLHQYTGRVSAAASAALADAAATVRAPSRVVLVGSAAGAGRLSTQGQGLNGPAERRLVAEDSEAPGMIERTLRRLGVTDVRMLRRGAEIDRAGEQLIIDAAEAELHQNRPRAATKTGSAPPPLCHSQVRESVSGRHSAAASPGGRAAAQREAPQAEP